MKPEKVFYTHFYLKNEKIAREGRLTIAIQVTDEGVGYGYSFCNPKDLFVKAEGRMNAKDRLEVNKYRITGVTKNIESKSPFEVCHIVAELVHKLYSPHWAKDAYLSATSFHYDSSWTL